MKLNKSKSYINCEYDCTYEIEKTLARIIESKLEAEKKMMTNR